MDIAITEEYIHNSRGTYLYISSLEVSGKYVLHGPLLATYWAWPCPHSGERASRRHACPEDAVYSLNGSGSSFTQRLFALRVASQQRTSEHYIIMYDAHIHSFYNTRYTADILSTSHSCITFTLSSLHFFSSSRQAGCPWLLMSDTVMLAMHDRMINAASP